MVTISWFRSRASHLYNIIDLKGEKGNAVEEKEADES